MLATCLFLVALTPPFLDEYSFSQRYYPEHLERNRIVACIRQYFQNGQQPICPIPFNENVKVHLDYAREIGVLFVVVN